MGLSAGLARFVAPLRDRIAHLVARGVVRLVSDTDALQRVQVGLLASELRGPIERFQQYGVTSHPFPGAEAVVLFRGGRRGHGLVVAVDDRRYRLVGLAEGEVAMYDDLGTRIVLRRGSRVEVRATELDAQVTGDALVDAGGAATVRAAGDATVEAGANLTAQAGGVARLEGAQVQIQGTTQVTIDAPLVSIQGLPDYKAHDHDPASEGDGTTGPPSS